MNDEIQVIEQGKNYIMRLKTKYMNKTNNLGQMDEKLKFEKKNKLHGELGGNLFIL